LTFADTKRSEGLQRAFVVDDTSQARAERKVEGTSCYFDHTEGRHRHGHQVRQWGLAAEQGFLPVEAQIVTGQKRPTDKPKDQPFRNQRSAAARHRHRAREQSKHQLFRQMLPRALRAGFRAGYLLADARFGCKENIAGCLENELVALIHIGWSAVPRIRSSERVGDALASELLGPQHPDI
jgi:hypothetical protein